MKSGFFVTICDLIINERIISIKFIGNVELVLYNLYKMISSFSKKVKSEKKKKKYTRRI